MEGHALTTRRHKGLALASRVKSPPTSGYGRSLLFICGGLYFILTLFGAVKWSLSRHTAIDDALLFPADSMAPRKLLAVVVPTHAGDLKEAVVALSGWVNYCSAITLSRMHLVVYYAGNAGDGVWSEEVLPTVTQTAGRCFEHTRVIFADLDQEVTRSNVSLAVPV